MSHFAPLTALFILLSLLPFISADSSTTYAISPASFPNLCVAPLASSDGSALIVTDCDSSASIAWTLNGGAFTNADTGMCVDVTNGGDWSGNKLQVWECFAGNTNQAYTLSGNAIQWSAGNNMCFDLTDGVGSDGTKVQIWSCFSGNSNQQWVFTEIEEVDGCDADGSSSSVSASETASYSAAASLAASASATAFVSAADVSVTASDSVTSSSAAETASNTAYATASASATSPATATVSVSAVPSATTSTIGGELWAGNDGSSSAGQSSSQKNHHSSSQKLHHSKSTSAASAASTTATSSSSWGSATSSDSLGASSSAVSTTASDDSWSATSSAADGSATGSSSGTATASATKTTSTATTSSGYLQVSGTSVVDSSGNVVTMRGINFGGWLVLEDWMCGITDSSGGADRFSQTTLENRFGEDQAWTLMNAWFDNWSSAEDWTTIANMGFNMVRLPFSYRNFQKANGSWITDSNGDVDLSRLDWAVAQAKANNIYLIPTFHIWETQDSDYSLISENSDAGQAARDQASTVWEKVAGHFVGESTIAAFDAINEPTGSYANNLQQDLYTAIRSVDANRIIVMESISTNPSQYGWTNVVYSMHEYLMMTGNDGSNEAQYSSGLMGDVNSYQGVGVPAYVGEFMAMGDTLTWMLDQLNNDNLWWSAWAYKTVNMGGWGLFNYPGSFSVDVGSDDYNTILNQWSNMGTANKNNDIYSVYKNAAGGSSSQKKRDVEGEKVVAVRSPRAGSTRGFSGGHKGRSRVGRMMHGQKGSF